MSAPPAAYVAAERAARESYGKLLAYLSARCGDVERAQDALAQAFASALEHWPADGVPRAPEAWLLVAARRTLFDDYRRSRRWQELQPALETVARAAQRTFERAGEIEDERLAFMFACTDPAIAPAIRAPLILQLVLGLDAARIASVFLVAPATMSQRLVRAKRKIAAANIRLPQPPPADVPARLDAVLAAIYAAFVAGWNDPNGCDPAAAGFATEALWLARVVADLVPQEPEALGLLALMLHTDARRATRRSRTGAYVPLDEQDPAMWDLAQIDEAESLLRRAGQARRPARFQLEAAIASAHAPRRFGREPDWDALLMLYDELLRLTGSPVVALNRAVALGRVHGWASALEALAALAGNPSMLGYQPYWAARADLLARVGDRAGARVAYERAIGLCIDPAVRCYLIAQAERCYLIAQAERCTPYGSAGDPERGLQHKA